MVQALRVFWALVLRLVPGCGDFPSGSCKVDYFWARKMFNCRKLGKIQEHIRKTWEKLELFIFILIFQKQQFFATERYSGPRSTDCWNLSM